MDREARFRRLFDATYEAVRRYALHRGLASADADDLVADVFTVAWQKLEQVPADDPVPWLFAVARNHWRNVLRKRQRDVDLTLRLRSDPTTSSTARDVPNEDVRRVLASLAETDQELLRLSAWDGLSPAQIAVVFGCSSAAARVRLHRARRRFAETFRAPRTGTSERPLEVRHETT